MSSSIDITKLSPSASRVDFATCARIHKEAISDGFLATLNLGVLERIYSTAADSPHAFLYVARKDTEILGFICGSLSTGRFYRDCISRHFFALSWYMLPTIISWRTVRRIAETLLYPARKTEDPDLPESEILNFCVTGAARGQGVGGCLFSALVDEFRRQQIPAIRIVTGENQKEAISFYETRDARLAQEIELHKGVKSLIYTYHINQGQGAICPAERS